METAKNYKPHFITTVILFLVATVVLSLMYQKTVAEKKALLKLAQINLELYNQSLVMETKARVENFKQYLKKPETTEKVGIWYGFIEKTEPILSNMENLLATQMQQQQTSKEERIRLLDRLRQACSELIAVVRDSMQKRIPRLPLQRLQSDSIKKTDILWNEKLLLQTDDNDWKFVLLNLHNELIRSAAIVKSFCTEQMCILNVVYDKFESLIWQNSRALLPGQTFELKAGIGAFSATAKPSIFINGQLMKTTESGYAEYKKVVTENDPGNFLVTVGYNDKNGVERTMTQTITYKVLKP